LRPARMRRAFRFVRSWSGLHSVAAVNAALTLGTIFVLLHGTHLTGARGSIAVVVVELAVFQLAMSAASVVTRRIDRHFRLTTANKIAMLAMKMCFLALPSAEPVRVPGDMRFIWSCGASEACPVWCTDRPAGQCSYAAKDFSTVGDADMETSCLCESHGVPEAWQRYLLWVQCLLTYGFVVALIFFDARELLAAEGAVSLEMQERTPRPKLTVLTYGIVSLVPALCLLLVLLDLEGQATECYRDIVHIAQVGAACAPLLLLANELKWILVPCIPDNRPHGSIWSGGGFDLIRPAAVAGPLLAACSIAAGVAGRHHGQCAAFDIAHVVMLAVGAVAALVSPSLQRAPWMAPEPEGWGVVADSFSTAMGSFEPEDRGTVADSFSTAMGSFEPEDRGADTFGIVVSFELEGPDRPADQRGDAADTN